MSRFQSSQRLQRENHPTPSTTSQVLSTTSPLSSSLESHPVLGPWWLRNFGLGPSRDLPRGTSARKVQFSTSSGSVPISNLNFGPKLLAVSSGPRVSLYGAEASEFQRTLMGRGGQTPITADRQIPTGNVAGCAVYRSDGRLIAVGTEDGVVQVCDASRRAMLRTFNASRAGRDRKAIRDLAWLRCGKRLLAAGDDGLVRLWSLAGGSSAHADEADVSLVGHGDSVRSVKVLSYRRELLQAKTKQSMSKDEDVSGEENTWNQLAVSGSYDHTIRVWDLSNDASSGDRCLAVMNHGDPVQALLILPSIDIDSAAKHDNVPLIASAGGTTIKFWNPFSGTCLGTFLTKHAKTITSMCLIDIPVDDSTLDSQKRQIITGGLDGLLRIHSASLPDILSGSLPFLHGMRVLQPISALAVSPNLSRLAIGTTSGVVTVYQRRRVAQQEQAKRYRKPQHGTYSYFMRGAHEKSHDPDDYLLMHQKRQKLAEYDVLLRKFRCGDALDKVLESRQPQEVMAVIEELGKRCGLITALSNRDEESLESILSFTIRFIDHPQYTPYLIGVAHILCDIYGSVLGQSEVVDELFAKLKAKVRGECAVGKMLLGLLGQIDAAISSAEMLSMERQQR